MREDLKENIKLSMQKSLPFVLSLLLIFFNYIPFNSGISGAVRPATGMICVFYWVLHRPDLFNMLTVFFLGFASDIMSSVPLGTDMVAYLAVYVMVSNMTAFFINKPYVAVWYGFAFIFVSAELIKWLIVSVYYAKFISLGSLFFTILFTIACYPIISFVNDLARKYLMNDEG